MLNLEASLPHRNRDINEIQDGWLLSSEKQYQKKEINGEDSQPTKLVVQMVIREDLEKQLTKMNK